MKKPVTYDVDRLIQLVEQQYPEELKIIENLKQCTEAYWRTKADINFVSRSRITINRLDPQWELKESLVVDDEKEGMIVIDIFNNDDISGIEFVSYIR